MLLAEVEADTITLATQTALATAQAGGRVLWLSLSGDAERPVLFLLGALSGVPVRSIFVERSLHDSQWAALAEAREQLEALDFMVADAHAFSVAEARSVCSEAMCDMPLDLVIVEGARVGDRRVLESLDELEHDLGVPVLVPGTCDDVGADRVEGWLAELRPRSLVLRLRREGDASRDATAIPCVLEVQRTRSEDAGSVPLILDPSRRRVVAA